jgi:hypothetical protein
MYKIISPKLGTPGDVFEPADGINIQALIDGGFVEETHTSPGKSAKNKTKAPDAANTDQE